MARVALCSAPEEFAQAFAPISHYFGAAPSSSELARIQQVFDYRRTMLAFEGEQVVGGCGAHAYDLTIPNGSVRAAGVTIVGVQPTHRRRGILRDMMRSQLDQVHAWREPVAFLWASEETIYGRFGYGMASLCADFEIPKAAATFAEPRPSRAEVKFVVEDDAYAPIAEIYERIRPEYAGMFSRSENWWKYRRLFDPEQRQGGGPLNRVLLYLDGKPEAYALYRIHQSLDRGVSKGFVNVIEAIATTPEASREIWRYLLEIDWVGSVKAALLPVDHPLLLQVSRPRMMNWRVMDALWVRLVDVEAAVAARLILWKDRAMPRPHSDKPLVLDVQDAFCPWNEGRYRVGQDGVRRTADDADLTLDVSVLGSVYLGGFSFRQMLRAERIVERTRHAAARADALFPSERAPWCPEVF